MLHQKKKLTTGIPGKERKVLEIDVARRFDIRMYVVCRGSPSIMNLANMNRFAILPSWYLEKYKLACLDVADNESVLSSITYSSAEGRVQGPELHAQ